jgi:hypothetical protein
MEEYAIPSHVFHLEENDDVRERRKVGLFKPHCTSNDKKNLTLQNRRLASKFPSTFI